MSTLIRVVVAVLAYVFLLPATCLLAIPALAIRSLSSLYIRLRYGERVVAWATGIDAVWPATEDKVINVLLKFSGVPSVHTLRQLFHCQICGTSDTGSCHADVAKLRSIPQTVCGQLVWIEDRHFSIDNHIFEHVLQTGQRLDSKQGVQEVLGELVSTSLPTARAKWQLLLIRQSASGFISTSASGVSYGLLRVDHIIGDGMSLLCVTARRFLADSRIELPSLSSQSASGRTSQRRGGVWTACAALLHAPGVIANTLTVAPDNSSLHCSRPLSGKHTVSWTEAFDTASLRSAAKRLDCRVNELLLACLSLACRQLLSHTGDDLTQATISVAMPVNMRHTLDNCVLDNRVSIARINLPLKLADMSDVISDVRRQMEQMKRSGSVLTSYAMSLLTSLLAPHRLTHKVMTLISSKSSLLTSNLIAPSHFISLASRRVDELMFWVPCPGHSGIGIGLSFFTYRQRLTVGVIADTAALTHCDTLTDLISQQITALLPSS